MTVAWSVVLPWPSILGHSISLYLFKFDFYIFPPFDQNLSVGKFFLVAIKQRLDFKAQLQALERCREKTPGVSPKRFSRTWGLVGHFQSLGHNDFGNFFLIIDLKYCNIQRTILGNKRKVENVTIST